MKCFTHREAEAVGVCKHCGKALCEVCVAVGEGGLSCRGPCEAHVRRPGQAPTMVDDRRRSRLRLLGAGGAVLGCVLLYLGYVSALSDDPGLRPAGALFGGALILFSQAAVCLWMARPSQGT